MKGFTLVELLIVISIIGILTTFVVVKMQESSTLSRDMKIEADFEIIRNGLLSYRSNNFNNIPLLNCTIGEGTCADNLFTYLSPYLDFIPLPDEGVSYTYSSDGTDCTVSAFSSTGTPLYEYRCSQI